LRSRANLTFGNVILLDYDIAGFYSIYHNTSEATRYSNEDVLRAARESYLQNGIHEGLSTLSYQVLAVEKNQLFTKIYVTYDELEYKSARNSTYGFE
jgi:hypothetical protein